MRPADNEFWASVDKQPGTDGCWIWTGRRHTAGYGCLRFDGRDQGAHRYAWILAHGEVAPTAHVLHHCPNRACVRPAHLLALTPAEAGPYKTARGYMARGDRHTSHLYPERQARGERQGSAKLTGRQVEQIRLRYADGAAPITRLAKEYGVGTSQIWRIVTGKSRQHDPGPTRPHDAPPSRPNQNKRSFCHQCDVEIEDGVGSGAAGGVVPARVGQTQRRPGRPVGNDGAATCPSDEPATITEGAGSEFAWKFWSLSWPSATAGEHTITSRATDTAGNVQPAMTDPRIANKKTYWESNGQITRRVQIG